MCVHKRVRVRMRVHVRVSVCVCVCFECVCEIERADLHATWFPWETPQSF